jgi:hypothetical protein
MTAKQMRLLLERINSLRSPGVADVRFYVTARCAACDMVKNSQLHVRLAHALQSRVQIVDCSLMTAAELVGLRKRGVSAVPCFWFRLKDGSEFVSPPQRISTVLSDFRGDPRVFCVTATGQKTCKNQA